VGRKISAFFEYPRLNAGCKNQRLRSKNHADSCKWEAGSSVEQADTDVTSFTLIATYSTYFLPYLRMEHIMTGSNMLRGSALWVLASYIIALVLSALVLGTSISTVDAATSTITPASMAPWHFQISGTASGRLVAGPATPPLGSGSVRLSTGSDGDSGAQFRNGAFSATPLANITALNYYTYVTNNQGCQAPYVILNIDNDNNGSIDDLLFFEPCYQTGTYTGSTVPNQGNVALNTWQQWNAMSGGWWPQSGNNSGPPLTTLAQYNSAHPNSRIINSATGSGGIRLTAGFGAPVWNNFVGYADAFTIGVSGNNTTYNFERGPGAVVVAPCDAYADQVTSFNQGNRKNNSDVPANRSNPAEALGAPGAGSTVFVTLGFSGSIVLHFDNHIINGAGPDVRIYESSLAQNYPLERAQVFASQTGTGWTLIGTADNSDNCNCTQNTTDLDLGALPSARYIRLVDTTNPALHSNTADAFDLNSVQALNNSCIAPGSSSSSSSTSSISSSSTLSSSSSSTSSAMTSSSSVSSSSSAATTSSSVSSVSSSSTSVSSSASSGGFAARPFCDGKAATIYVGSNGRIVGGKHSGMMYSGVLHGTMKNDVIVGTSGNDVIFGNSGDDTICAGAGNDRAEGDNGKDRIAGEAGNDEIEGSNSQDLLCGGDGNDELDAGNSQDNLDGGAGTDTLDGGNSQDACRNGENNDDCESSGNTSLAQCAGLVTTPTSASSVSSSSVSSMTSSSNLSSSSTSSASSGVSSASSLSSFSSSSSSSLSSAVSSSPSSSTASSVSSLPSSSSSSSAV